MAPPTTRPAISALAAAGALALGSTLLGLGTAAPAQAAAPTARVWVTTADGGSTLEPRGEVPFTSGREGIDIAVDPGQRFQRFTGAGASVTEASAHLIGSLPQGERDALMESLFSRDGGGIGLNYLRQPLGGTDFNAGSFYTYEDTPGRFGIDRDRQEIIPVLREALAANPGIRFMGSPWSPPAWMKTGGSLNGGSLDPAHYGDYADYLVSAVEAYGEEGIELTDLTVQNEPLFATSYPSTSMSAQEQADFFRVLDGALADAGLDTRLYAYDHNWDRTDYPLEVFEATRGIERVQGAAFHCYGGRPEAQQQIVDAGKRVFFTECSGTDSADPASTFADTLRWHSENLVVRNMRSGGETVLTWNLALDGNGGPHQGHCEDRCNGVVEIDGSRVTRNAEYYMLGHLTRFVDEGARRIGSTSQGSGGVQNVVFENPGGGRAAYVTNAASGPRTFSITEGGDSLSYTLPAGAVATFTWSPAGDGGDPGEQGETIVPDTPYQVVGADSGKCLDAADWGTGDGTGLQQWECGTPGQANQTWRFLPTGDGHHQVLNQHAGAVWDVDGGPGATADGARVHLWSYVGAANQQWRPEEVSGGTYRFVARHSGKCLTLDGGADGAGLTQQPCGSADGQSFRVRSAA
ncbi:glycosyl hydrolase [Nocardiopsis sp. TSRI0078]|uniref:RICIN domain-containing protein n=1 Tax=unclassified Nocardiopsis TaxID=2649073 RepID=UPI00093ADDB5|nr:RICIN domain-containing protein [Nocardiopsis sp. TSRI0078]OKI14413.1 glycosyl hydrolase [Nocardiopsis sp. TSRI0078]